MKNNNIQQSGNEAINRLFKNEKTEKQPCIIDRAVKQEIEAGVPKHRRTKAWFISCPCPKCSPFTL